MSLWYVKGTNIHSSHVRSHQHSLYMMTTGYDYTVLCPLMSKLTFNVHEVSWALDLIKYVYSQLSMLSFIVLILYDSSATLLPTRAHSNCALQHCENHTFNHYWQDIKCLVVYLMSSLTSEYFFVPVCAICSAHIRPKIIKLHSSDCPPQLLWCIPAIFKLH